MVRVALVSVVDRRGTVAREWIDVHAALGVSTFYIYDASGSFATDDARCHVISSEGPDVEHARAHFIETVMPGAAEEWFAFVGCDEFLCPVKHASIPDVLREHGDLESIGALARKSSLAASRGGGDSSGALGIVRIEAGGHALETLRAALGPDHPATPRITRIFRDNPRRVAFVARAAAAYSMQEGSVDDAEAQFLTEFVRSHRLTKILEIGFNGGMSASAFLGAADSVRLVSVDLGEWPCVTRAAELIDQMFPGRHTLHLGDSRTVVPALPRDDTFELAFVDGGHFAPVPLADLENVLPLVRDGGWIIMDDYCVTHGSHGVISAWDEMVRRGLIRQVSVHESGERGWAVGVKVDGRA